MRDSERFIKAWYGDETPIILTVLEKHSPRTSAIVRVGPGSVGGYVCFDSIRAWGSAPRILAELDENDGSPVLPCLLLLLGWASSICKTHMLIPALWYTNKVSQKRPDDRSLQSGVSPALAFGRQTWLTHRSYATVYTEWHLYYGRDSTEPRAEQQGSLGAYHA